MDIQKYSIFIELFDVDGMGVQKLNVFVECVDMVFFWKLNTKTELTNIAQHEWLVDLEKP
jgi:hypothetical protein